MATKTVKSTAKTTSAKTSKTATKTTKKTTAKRPKTKKKLVIVESPSKAKTIGKYLGRTYKVVASLGHVRDLPKSRMGVDIEHDYQPDYISIRGKGNVIKELRKDAKQAKAVYLASDPDREGEAIAWHVANILKLDTKDKNRVTFNEITKDAVKEAFKEPREINMDLVDAQQARRVLDRLVGYSISPILWKKVKKGDTMSNIKTERISDALIEQISYIIATEVKNKDINFVTITDVKVSNDLSYAKVYFTVLNESKIDVTSKALKEASGFIRHELRDRVDIRQIPELEFVYDESIKNAQKIENIIDKLHEDK